MSRSTTTVEWSSQQGESLSEGKIRSPWSLLPPALSSIIPNKPLYVEQSCIGPEIARTGRVISWAPQGCILELWHQLRDKINSCLCHETISLAILLSCHICGKGKHKARPTVIIWGADTATRKRAQELIHQERIFDDTRYYGWIVWNMPRAPGYHDLQPLMNGDMQTSVDDDLQALALDDLPDRHDLISMVWPGRRMKTLKHHSSNQSPTTVYDGDDNWNHFKAHRGEETEIQDRHSKQAPVPPLESSMFSREYVVPDDLIGVEIRASKSRYIIMVRRKTEQQKYYWTRHFGTLSGPVKIGARWFFITAAHVLTGRSFFDVSTHRSDTREEDKREEEDDDDEDAFEKLFDSDSGTDDEQCSRGESSQSSPSSVKEGTSGVWLTALRDHVGIGIISRWSSQLGGYPPLCSASVDYALIPATSQFLGDQFFDSYEWYRPGITTFDPPTGLVRMHNNLNDTYGEFLPNATLYKPPGQPQLLPIWIFRLASRSDRLVQGDSGSLVYSSDKKLVYGLVIAGSMSADSAFVLPSHILYDHILANLGSRPRFAASQSDEVD